MTDTKADDYEALGIFPDTWACIAVLERKEAEQYVFDLAASGVETQATKDPDGKRWHIAVKGGLKGCPVAWVVGLRNEPYNPVACPPYEGQHPQTTREQAIELASTPRAGIEQQQAEDR